MLKKGCIFLISKEALYGQSLQLSVICMSTYGSLLETQAPRPNPGPPASEPALQIPRDSHEHFTV